MRVMICGSTGPPSMRSTAASPLIWALAHGALQRGCANPRSACRQCHVAAGAVAIRLPRLRACRKALAGSKRSRLAHRGRCAPRRIASLHGSCVADGRQACGHGRRCHALWRIRPLATGLKDRCKTPRRGMGLSGALGSRRDPEGTFRQAKVMKVKPTVCVARSRFETAPVSGRTSSSTIRLVAPLAGSAPGLGKPLSRRVAGRAEIPA